MEFYLFIFLQIDGLLPSKKATLATSTPGSAGKAGAGLDAETLAQAALLQKMKSQYGPQKMMSALMSMISSDPPGPPSAQIPGLNEPPPSTSTTLPTSTSTRGYYSSGSLTATYSSSPQPPDSHPAATEQYHTQEQYGYPPSTYSPGILPTTPYGYPQSQYTHPYQPATPTPPYYQHTSGVADHTQMNPLNPIFQKK